MPSWAASSCSLTPSWAARLSVVMLTISARALVIACVLAVTLAVVANLLTPPMWAVYIAFAAIIGIFVVLNERHTERADPDRPPRSHASRPAQ